MANITFDRYWTGSETEAGFSERVVRRLRAFARTRRINRRAHARRGLVRDEQASDRLLVDVGIDAREHRRYDWFAEMFRVAGGPMR